MPWATKKLECAAGQRGGGLWADRIYGTNCKMNENGTKALSGRVLKPDFISFFQNSPVSSAERGAIIEHQWVQQNKWVYLRLFVVHIPNLKCSSVQQELENGVVSLESKKLGCDPTRLASPRLAFLSRKPNAQIEILANSPVGVWPTWLPVTATCEQVLDNVAMTPLFSQVHGQAAP